jgi:class 3 adenylate cyclase
VLLGTAEVTVVSHPYARRNDLSSRLALIVEIIELMEERQKNKEWLIQHMKQKKEQTKSRSSPTIAGVLKGCSIGFLTELDNLLKSGDPTLLMGPPPLTRTYHWFFTDIVASTEPSITTNEQAYKIIALNTLIQDTEVFKNRNLASTIILPTGDGMAIGFDDSPEKPLNLAIQLHKKIKEYNEQIRRKPDKLLIRIGLDTGPVYMIRDLNGHDNVWGSGIIMARRVMDIAGSMNILVSSKLAQDIRDLRPEYRGLLHPVGDYSIKHRQKVLIYNAFDETVGNRKAPPHPLQKSKADDEIRKISERFLFSKIMLELEVLDEITMMTHHMLEWSLQNISNDTIDKVFFYLEGDTPKEFSELHMVIRDGDGKELNIVSLDKNKPYKKAFHTKLRKPLKPQETGKVIYEWDWEEPERHYEYRMASDCKKFYYKLLVPRHMSLKQKVVREAVEIGLKTHAEPPTVRYLKDKIEITWSAKNLQMFDAYRFDW